jgi:molecular chaperone DnaK (HSP70)
VAFNEKLCINLRDIVTPEAVMGAIIQYVIKKAEEFLMDADVVGVIISVPTSFKSMQRLATIQAAKIAGLQTIHICATKLQRLF